MAEKKRHQVYSACVPCRNSHIACNNQRPCSHCVNKHTESSCIDVKRIHTGGRKRNNTDNSENPQLFIYVNPKEQFKKLPETIQQPIQQPIQQQTPQQFQQNTFQQPIQQQQTLQFESYLPPQFQQILPLSQTIPQISQNIIQPALQTTFQTIPQTIYEPLPELSFQQQQQQQQFPEYLSFPPPSPSFSSSSPSIPSSSSSSSSSLSSSPIIFNSPDLPPEDPLYALECSLLQQDSSSFSLSTSPSHIPFLSIPPSCEFPISSPSSSLSLSPSISPFSPVSPSIVYDISSSNESIEVEKENEIQKRVANGEINESGSNKNYEIMAKELAELKQSVASLQRKQKKQKRTIFSVEKYNSRIGIDPIGIAVVSFLIPTGEVIEANKSFRKFFEIAKNMFFNSFYIQQITPKHKIENQKVLFQKYLSSPVKSVKGVNTLCKITGDSITVELMCVLSRPSNSPPVITVVITT